ncbi:MAG: RodZ domain-containing protein, partial [Gaiellaceae bacterium]
WVEARRGSADGRVLFLGTLATGRSLHFRGKRIWLRLGAPAGLRARLDGRSLALPDRTSTILVRKGGLRVLDVDTPAPSPAPAPVVVSPRVVYAPPSSEPSEAGATSSSPPPSPDESPSPDPRPPAGPGDDPESDGKQTSPTRSARATTEV